VLRNITTNKINQLTNATSGVDAVKQFTAKATYTATFRISTKKVTVKKRRYLPWCEMVRVFTLK